jgi:hypothetical protein
MECKLEDFNNCDGSGIKELLKKSPIQLEDHPEASENWRDPFSGWSNDSDTLVVVIDHQGPSNHIEKVLYETEVLLELVATFHPDEYDKAQVGSKVYHRLWWD